MGAHKHHGQGQQSLDSQLQGECLVLEEWVFGAMDVFFLDKGLLHKWGFGLSSVVVSE